LQTLFPPKRSLVNAQQKKKKRGKKRERNGEERKRKVKVEGARKLLNPKTCCLGMPELQKL